MSSNSRTSYGMVSRFNHWLVAIAILLMLPLGLTLEFGPLDDDTARYWRNVHKAAGVLVLAFGLWRVGWRLARGFPRAVSSGPEWQLKAARAAHWFLLAAIVLMPISGLVRSVFRGRGVSVFGWFEIPTPGKVEWLASVGSTVHAWLGYLLVAIVAVHVAAALKHHFADRDATLMRMLSGRSG